MQTVKQVDKNWLMGVPAPIKTQSYSPVNHIQLLDYVEKELGKTDYTIQNRSITSTNNGSMIIVGYDLVGSQDPDIGNRIFIRNSYDKSKSVLIVSGGQVYVCSNGMIINAEQQFRRKHTGEVWLDIMTEFREVIKHMEEEMFMLTQAKLHLQQAPLYNPIDQVANMLGHMFYKEEIIGSVQLNIMKEELQHSKTFRTVDDSKFTLWDFYNSGTQALKRSHPSTYIESHANLHKYVMGQIEEVEYV